MNNRNSLIVTSILALASLTGCNSLSPGSKVDLDGFARRTLNPEGWPHLDIAGEFIYKGLLKQGTPELNTGPLN